MLIRVSAERPVMRIITKDAADLSDASPVNAEHVYQQLLSNYPPKSISWVRDLPWIGPINVPLDRVDWDSIDEWAASHQKKRVKKFQRRIRSGDADINPVVGVQVPGDDRLKIVDGHHRALAYRKEDQPVKAYVGFAPSGNAGDPWFNTHSYQVKPGESPANKSTLRTSNPGVEDDRLQSVSVVSPGRYGTVLKNAELPDLVKVGPKGYIHGWIYVGPEKVPNSPAALEHPDIGLSVLRSLHNGVAETESVMSGERHQFRAQVSHVMTPGLYREKDLHIPEDPPENQDDAQKRVNSLVAALPEAKKPSFTTRLWGTNDDKWGDPHLAKAVEDYIAPHTNDEINGSLRAGNPPGWVSEEASMLDDLAKQQTLKSQATVYRGFAATKSILDQLTPGQEFTDRAFVSTSYTPKWAGNFAMMRSYGNGFIDGRGGKPVIMKINVPAGAHMFQGEKNIDELVLPRGSKFRVTSASSDGLISVDIMPPGGD